MEFLADAAVAMLRVNGGVSPRGNAMPEYKQYLVKYLKQSIHITDCDVVIIDPMDSLASNEKGFVETKKATQAHGFQSSPVWHLGTQAMNCLCL